MARDEIIKEVRKLFAMNQSEATVTAFLGEMGYNKAEVKEFIDDAKKGYAIESDLEKLRQMGEKAGEGYEKDDKPQPKTEQEKRISFVKEELGDLQGIIKNIRTDIDVEPQKKPEKKKESS